MRSAERRRRHGPTDPTERRSVSTARWERQNARRRQRGDSTNFWRTNIHTTTIKIQGRKKYAVKAVIEGAESAYKFAKNHDHTLKIEIEGLPGE